MIHKLIVCLIIMTTTAGAQTTRYAGDPFLLGAGARALAMGGAYVAISSDATALSWNAAGLALLSHKEIHVQHTEQFGGSVNHDVVAISIPVSKGSVGVGIVRIGVDNISLTILEDPTRPLGPDNRPIVSNTVGTTDYVLRTGYGRTINSKLNLGATLKLIRRNLNQGTGNGLGIDIGILYTPIPTINLALSVYDLTKTRIAFPNGITDRISPSVLIGTALTHVAPGGQIIVSASTRLNDSKSAQENNRSIYLGTEYRYQQQLSFRLGLREGHFTAGTGLKRSRFAVDLAFLSHDTLDSTYRISATLFF